jgi:hypothetical protein
MFDEGERAMLPARAEYDPVPFAHPRYWAPFIIIGKP